MPENDRSTLIVWKLISDRMAHVRSKWNSATPRSSMYAPINVNVYQCFMRR